MDEKLKHLEFVQAIISRMATCSFHLKGWTVTLVAALLALSTTMPERLAVIMITIIPIITFWGLDGFFLNQEKRFRELYKQVSQQDSTAVDFAMCTPKVEPMVMTVFSKTLLPFYGSLLLALGGIAIWLSTT